MISSHRLYRHFAEKLFQEIHGAFFSHALSFTKDGLLLHFIRHQETLSYEVKFVEGELIITNANWTDFKSKLKSNAVVQFKELENKTVYDIKYGLFDRVFALIFNDGSRLLFKSFGKFGNVIHYHEEDSVPNSVFRLNFKKDWELDWNHIQTLWQSLSSSKIEIPYFENSERWNQHIKGMPTSEVLFRFPNFFNQSVEEQIQNISELSRPVLYKPALVIEGEKAHLDWIYCPTCQWNDIQIELESQIRVYLKWYFFEREKTLLQLESARQLKSINQKLKTYKSRKEALINQRSFKELGDLILGHAHSIRKGTSEALITDFFTGQRIRIKLNPDLSAAENAAKCYKKARNQGLEMGNLDEQINFLEAELKKWQDIDAGVQLAEAPKDLRPFREFAPQLKVHTSKQSEIQKPYKKIDFKNFEIWLGKNAKSNDALLRDSHKNDLWMHAADVTGSHVIIRNTGKSVPKIVLEEIAAFCAFHSKGKSQTLQTVMYTERKMVSKAKNGAPGEVKVSKFQTIDVEPKNLSFFS